MTSKARRLLTACVAGLALCALAPAVTFAAETGWKVGGTLLKGTESSELATTAKVDENIELTAAGDTVECKGSTLNATTPKISAPDTGSAASLEFTSCTASGENCSLTGGNASGVVGTLPISLEAALGSGKSVTATLKPTTGTAFATIAFTGAGCPLSGQQNLTGKISAQEPTGQEEKATQELKVTTSKESENLRIGGIAAKLGGATLLKLKSEKSWSFATEEEKTEGKGGWMVGGTVLSGSAELASTAKVVNDIVFTAAGATITCSGATLNGKSAQIESPSSGSATGLEFTGCSASSPCTLAGGNKSGVIGTLPIIDTTELKTGSTSAVLEHFSPKTGTTFATIAYTGTGCALSGKQPVNGKALVEGPTGQQEKAEQEIVAITTEASGELKAGSSDAALSGAVLLKLKSEKAWNYL